MPIRLVVVALLGIAVLALPFVSVRQTRSRMDAVSGSMEWQTTWPFGITWGPRVTPSPLELRLRQRRIPWTRHWQLLHNTHRTLVGTATCYECGSAPAIYQLKPALQQYADVTTDTGLRDFVSVMQSGTDDQQRRAVQAALDKALR
ncbi:MAG TPA: hypothetical protein VGI81_23675 [Tepidisphaeraceae bacterium]